MVDDISPPEPPSAPLNDSFSAHNAYRAPMGFGVLVFGFGLAAGVIMAFSGYAVLQDSASLVVTIFLAALFVVALVATLVFILRGPILRRVFGVAHAQMERFAEPLSGVAEAAIDRDPMRATESARDLVRMTFARYAWISTRRWIVAALTGLIAAMAALAGTALLFKQNELLAAQSVLLKEQNAKIQQQSAYLAQDVQLSEAARNAELAVQITRIAGDLGRVMEKHMAAIEATAKQQGIPPSQQPAGAEAIPVLSPGQLGARLTMQIVAASQAVKPYRFLKPELHAHDTSDKLRVAMQRRRGELKKSYAASARYFNWNDPKVEQGLIDRPASPERAQLLQALIASGLRELELLNWFGMDLSFAWATDIRVFGMSMQGAQLSYSNFDRANILQSDLRGAALENARFRKAFVKQTMFGVLAPADAKGPYATTKTASPTFVAGADFAQAHIETVSFSGAAAGSTRFDNALLIGVNFTGTVLAGATFRQSALLGVNFNGAALQSVDFDGALVFSANFLTDLAKIAAPGTFRPDRFEIERVAPDALDVVPAALAGLDPALIKSISGGNDIWRVKRVKPFEQPPVGAKKPENAED